MTFAAAPLTDPISHIAAGGGTGPVHYFCRDVLAERVEAFAAFPGLVTYAVKANPDPRVLAALDLEAFDVASPEEIALVRQTRPGRALHYNNPVRSRAEIAGALAAGVRSFAVDDAGELDKLVAQGAGAETEVSVRLRTAGAGAVYDFGSKFGATPEEGAALLSRVALAGLKPSITFHVGTQNTDPRAWSVAMAGAAEVAATAGVQLHRLNVGGGFPASREGGARDLGPIFAAIREAAFETEAGLVCEPGRALVADAFAYAVPVKSIRPGRVYLEDGIYGGLSEFTSMHLPRLRVVTPEGRMRTGEPTPVVVFGPTCDSLDRLPGEVPLPRDLAEGDWLLFDGMGAYLNGVTTTFNGYGARDTVEVQRL